MDIVPVYHGQKITAGSLEVLVNGEDRQRALALVDHTKTIAEVTGEESFAQARQAASQLKAMLDEIEASKKASKLPFTAVGRAIDNLASDIAGPIKNEQNRVLGLLNRYVAELEAARKMQERLEAEAKRQAQAEADRKVREAQEAWAKSQMELQNAKDEIDRLKLREAEQAKANALLQEELSRDLAADVAELEPPTEAPRGLVPGGRVDHVYDFELVDVNATVKAGCFRLLRWELDILACRDSVKTQLEMQPDMEPTLPGIKITKRLNVSVKAASRIK